MQGTVPGARRRGRPRTAWMDNIKTWTGLSVEESIRMTEDGENGDSTSMVWPTLGSRTAKEQNKQNRRGGSRFLGECPITRRYATSGRRDTNAFRVVRSSFMRHRPGSISFERDGKWRKSHASCHVFSVADRFFRFRMHQWIKHTATEMCMGFPYDSGER